MSVYEGSRIRQEYAHGRDEGRTWAEQDLATSPATTYWLTVLTQEVDTWRHVGHRMTRAFYLGALRGYREVLR